MRKFEVLVRVPETVWNEATLIVEAPSKKDALLKAKEMAEDPDAEIEWEDTGNYNGNEMERAMYEVTKCSDR